MPWFFLFLTWIYLFVALLTDIFRSPDLGGWGKALWCAALIVFPVLGALAYLMVRGSGMTERHIAADRQQEAAFRSYVQEAARAPADPGRQDDAGDDRTGRPGSGRPRSEAEELGLGGGELLVGPALGPPAGDAVRHCRTPYETPAANSSTR